MSRKLEHAKSLYLEGIRDGKINAVKKYSGDRYTQHSTGVVDGAEGFIDFFKDFLERTKKRDIQIIRAIEDGNYVFVHVFQNIDNGAAKWITTDLFDTDENDRLIEHWDVIAPYVEAEKTTSGNEMILGTFEIEEKKKTNENKAVIRNFLVDIFQNNNYKNIEKYIDFKDYIEHNAHRENGIESLKEFLIAKKVKYDFVFKVIGQGNYVVSYSKVIQDGEEWAVFDIFRMRNGKIVEHWDNMEQIQPRKEWVNTGKF